MLGVGFERSDDRLRARTSPMRSADSRRGAESFPSPEHAWGVQNFWVQPLADLGVVGLALALATFAIGLVLAARARPARAGCARSSRRRLDRRRGGDVERARDRRRGARSWR